MKDIMTDTIPLRTRLRRFIADRIACRDKAHYFLAEFVDFGILVFIAGWPVILMAGTMAHMPR